MTNTMKDLGGSICVDGYDGEVIIPMIADGTAKMGWFVGGTSGSSTIRGVNPTGNLDEFTGIQMRQYKTDINTAPTAGDPVSVLIPKAGRRYRVHIKDPGAAIYVGEPMIFIAGTAGAVDKAGDAEAEHNCRIAKDVANGDTYAEVIWGA